MSDGSKVRLGREKCQGRQLKVHLHIDSGFRVSEKPKFCQTGRQLRLCRQTWRQPGKNSTPVSIQMHCIFETYICHNALFQDVTHHHDDIFVPEVRTGNRTSRRWSPGSHVCCFLASSSGIGIWAGIDAMRTSEWLFMYRI
jgi:hypothetical protein